MRTSRMRSERHRRLAAARVRRCGARFVAAVILASAAAIPAHAQAPSVGTVYAERQPISDIRDFVGRVEATGRVDIRARVQGYLEQVLFKEGDIVKKGDPLYRIEKGLFQAAVEAGARARWSAARRTKPLTADPTATRARTPVGEKRRHRRRARSGAGRGPAGARRRSWPTRPISTPPISISAIPISPRRSPEKSARPMSRPAMSSGPIAASLTLIVSQDPMYVSFPVSQRELLQAQLSGRSPHRSRRHQGQDPLCRRHDLQPATARSISSTCRSIARPIRCWRAPPCRIRTAP